MPAVFGPYKSHSTLLGSAGQFERKKCDRDDDGEPASELQKADEVIHADTITQKATRRWLFALAEAKSVKLNSVRLDY